MPKLYTDKYGMRLLSKGLTAVVISEKDAECGFIFDIDKEGITNYTLTNPAVTMDDDIGELVHYFDCKVVENDEPIKKQKPVLYTDIAGIELLKSGVTQVVVADTPVPEEGFTYAVFDHVAITYYDLVNPECDYRADGVVTLWDIVVLD